MLSNISYYARPKSLEDAINLLSAAKGRYIIYAGGTSSLFIKQSKIKGFVSLRDLKLNYIKKSKTGIKIGAMTRIQELYESSIVNRFAKGILSKTSSKIGSTLNRNLITVGGNISQVFRWSDLPVSLLILDTKINVSGKKKVKYNITDFFSKHPKVMLKYDDIITDIEIKNPTGNYGIEFIKFSKTEFDYALIDVAVFLSLKNSKVADIRIAYGSINTLPFRAFDLEQEFKNKEIDSNFLDRVEEKSRKYISPVVDFRVSKDYQREIIGVITKRAIKSCLEQLGKI